MGSEGRPPRTVLKVFSVVVDQQDICQIYFRVGYRLAGSNVRIVSNRHVNLREIVVDRL